MTETNGHNSDRVDVLAAIGNLAKFTFEAHANADRQIANLNTSIERVNASIERLAEAQSTAFEAILKNSNAIAENTADIRRILQILESR